jgi:hydrogenase maturation factor
MADVNGLKIYYGNGFNENAIPKILNVETIVKSQVETSLKTSTKNTTKGEYQKINHGGVLLEKIDEKKVRRSAHFCEILFNIIAKKIG